MATPRRTFAITHDHDIPAFSPVCTYCRHWKPGEPGRVCDAFPTDPPGIPMTIWRGTNRHTTPVRGQKNRIVFEVLPEATAAAKKAGLI